MIRKRSSKKSRGFGSSRNNLSKNFQRRASFEPLESRNLLSVTLPELPDQTILAGAPLNLPLHSTGTTNPVEYTVSVNNANVTAAVPTGNTYLKLTVNSPGNSIQGDMIFQLFNDVAPKTVGKITGLVNQGFYNGLTFHRIMEDFMIQGGDPIGDGTGGPGFKFDDEFNVSNLKFTSFGLLAMANSGPDTNGSQFFITTEDTRWLDFKHTIFGMIVQGSDILDALDSVPTSGDTAGNKPLSEVKITSASIITDTADGVVRLSAPNNGTGTSVVTVTARDMETDETSVQQFTVTVAADTSNERPFLGTINPIQTTPGTPINYQIPATDVEGDAIYYFGNLTQTNANLSISVNSTTGQLTVTPTANLAPGVYNVRLGAAINASAVSANNYDSQIVPIYINPLAPTSVQLLTASDTGGSNSDKLTGLNNSTGKTLQFQVNGVQSGRTVQLFSDGTLIGEATATGTTVVITTNGTVTLTDGSHAITAKQVIKNQNYTAGNLTTTTDLTSPVSSALSITVDATVPAFNFQPITTAVPGKAYKCRVTVAPPNNGVTFELIQKPSGMAIDAATGQISWTPTAEQLASTNTVTVKATDLAGNTAQTTYSIKLNTAPVLTQAIPGSVYGPIVGYTSPTNPIAISLSSFINHGAGSTTITDSDAGAILGGIALSFTNVLGTGSWQYSLDGGTTFQPMVVSDASAILLPHDAFVRYTPGGTETGTVFIAYRAWDMSSGSPGDHIDLSQKDPNQNVIGTGGNNSVGVDGDNIRIIINNAPVLTAGQPNIGPVQEDSAIVFDFSNQTFLKTLLNNGAGTSIITDADQDPYTGGIAITGFTGDGTWEYAARNNSPFVAIDSISAAHALLLSSAGSKLRYTPNPNSNSPATFTYVAWDKSSGSNGDFVDLSKAGSTGGATPFSAISDTATVTITPVNDAPTLQQANPEMTRSDSSASVTIPVNGTFINHGEGTTTITDIDTGAVLGGIAVIGVTGSGSWEYSTDGTTYLPIPSSIDDATALLLSKNAILKYTPGSDNSVQPTIAYRAWDTTSGQEGDSVDLSQTGALGGTTAFSSLADTAKITINNAPVLVSANPSLGSTNEDAELVFDLASFINASNGTTITDAEQTEDLIGIALIGAAGNGTWAYSLDGGTTFVNVGTVGPTAALLLPKTAKLRYTPDGKNGETTQPSILYRAWDTTSGEDGDKVDLSGNDAVGGSSAFSELTDNASLSVTNVNDAPVVTPANPVAGIITHATPKTFNLSDIIGSGTGKTAVADVDTGAVLGGIALIGIEGLGTWEYSLDDGENFVEITSVGASSALLLPSNTKLRYTPDSSSDSETAAILYHAWDATSGTAGSQVDLSPANSTGGTTPYSLTTDIASIVVNDAPVLTPVAGENPSLGIVGNTSPVIINLDGTFINKGEGTTTIADPNPNDTMGGIALVGVTGSGTWAYSLDGGTTFTNTGTIGPNAALLLPKFAILRYTPTTATSEDATIVFRAWDLTTGDAGEKIDLSAEDSRGGATAFSTATETATLTVRSAPTNITLNNSSIPDNSAVGSTVGTLSAEALEGGTFTYTLATGAGSADNSAFTISGNVLKTATTFNAIVKSSYSIRVRVTDQVGLTFEKVLTITITDKTQPTVTINQQVGQPDPTHSGSITYLVVFSENVADFTADDITLSGTAVGAGTVVKKVLGSGKNYEVQVSGMTGSGTVTAIIAAGKIHDAAGNVNLASTSTDNTVTYIKEWAVYGGTNSDDTIIFSPGAAAGTWQVRVNSTTWALPAGTKGITIDGYSGRDTLKIAGIGNNETLEYWADHATFRSGDFEVEIRGLEAFNFNGGGGVDSVIVHDRAGAADAFSAGWSWVNVNDVSISMSNVENCTMAATLGKRDTINMFGDARYAGQYSLIASPKSVSLNVPGYTMTAANFTVADTYILPGRGDTATFADDSQDQTSNDLFLVSTIGADMNYRKAGTQVTAWGFSRVNAASNAGSDEVRFYGKTGATDTFVVSKTEATYANPAFVNKATGFKDVQAYIDPNNNSTATLIDTAGADRLVTSPLGAQLFTTGFQSSAWGFRRIVSESTGGTDTADMYGSTAADTFTALPGSASFSGANFDRQLFGFSKVTAHGKPEDSAVFRDTASVPMNFLGKPTEASMFGTGFNNIAQGFGNVQAFAVVGNGAEAVFTDSAAKQDIYTASALGAQMKGVGYDYAAWGFSKTTATSTGGNDIAYLFGASSGENILTADSLKAGLTNTGLNHTAEGFAKLNVFSSLGANDIATFVGAAQIDSGLSNLTKNHKLVLNDFDELFEKADANATAVAHAIDEVMTAYWD